MNYDQFIKEYNGKSFDYDGVAGVQCVDLIKMYVDKVFGIKPGSWGNAKDYYENFNNLPLKIGDEVGKITVKDSDNKKIKEEVLTVTENVDKLNFLELLGKTLTDMLVGNINFV